MVAARANEPQAGSPMGLERNRYQPQNNELQRTSDGNAAGSPLNSVFYEQTPQG
jgi:hypothetical protein